MSAIKEENRPLAVIFGLSGAKLTDAECVFFKQANPLGFILFARNCESPEQLRNLTSDLRKCMERDVPVLIDQEGGRVNRLKQPHWNDRPASKTFGDEYNSDPGNAEALLKQNIDNISQDLCDAGINVNCAPVLDVLQPETHKAIGDRAFSDNPAIVEALAEQVSKNYLANGIIPVIKHLPGQGRAASDSHKDLPVVKASLKDLRATDFAPFKGLLSKDFSGAMWGMVAHVVYEAIDKKSPSTCSSKVIEDIIRGEIGFDGLLLSDDVEMNALQKYGDAASRVNLILNAGCDIALHCNGKMAEMQDIAAKVPEMSAIAIDRYNRSLKCLEQNKI